MTSFKRIGISPSDILKFTSYQKKVFLPQADRLISKVKYSESFDEYAKEIFKNLYKSSPTKISLFERGTLHYVYLVKDKKNKIVIRINKNNSLYKEFGFLIEEQVNKLLKEHNLPYVNILSIDLSRNVVPVDYQILEFIQGDTLYDLSKKGKLKTSNFVEFGKLIAKIHKTHTQNYGPFSVSSLFKNKNLFGIHKSWQNYLFCNLNKHIKFCVENKIFNKSFGIRLNKTLRIAIKSLSNIQPVLLHGDIANHNVFFNKNKILGLIDWEDTISGDAIYDLAFYGSGAFEKKDWFNGFKKGYESISKLPKDFEFRYLIYFLRISIAKAVVRQKTNAQNKNMNKRIDWAFSALLRLV